VAVESEACWLRSGGWNVHRSSRSPVAHRSLATSHHPIPCGLYWGLAPSTERSVKLQKAWLRMTSLSPSLRRFFQLRRFPDIGSRSGGKKPSPILQLQCFNSPLPPPPNKKPKNGLASSPLPFPRLPLRLQVLANRIPDEWKARNVHHHVTIDTVQRPAMDSAFLLSRALLHHAITQIVPPPFSLNATARSVPGWCSFRQ
jgi:hypothetical protein